LWASPNNRIRKIDGCGYKKDVIWKQAQCKKIGWNAQFFSIVDSFFKTVLDERSTAVQCRKDTAVQCRKDTMETLTAGYVNCDDDQVNGGTKADLEMDEERQRLRLRCCPESNLRGMHE